MRRAGAVNDDGASGPQRQSEAATLQFTAQALAVARSIPCLQRGGPNVDEPDARARFHQPFLRRRRRHGTFALDEVVPGHPCHDVVAAFFDEAVRDAAGVRSRRRLQAEIESHAEVHVRPAGVILPRVDAAAIGSDKAVNPVLVQAAFLVVLRADIRMRGQPELALEGRPPGGEDGLAVGGARRRIDVHVIAWAVRPAAACGSDEFGKLLVQVAACDDAAGWDHADGLAGFGFEQMGAQVAAAAASGAAGNHREIGHCQLTCREV